MLAVLSSIIFYIFSLFSYELVFGSMTRLYFLWQFIQPNVTGQPIDERQVALSAKVMKASLKKIETIYLKDTPFLNSDTMSIADFLGVAEVMQVQLGLGMDFPDFPKVTQWCKRVRETIGAELFDEAHKFLAIAGKKFQAGNVPTPKL